MKYDTSSRVEPSTRGRSRRAYGAFLALALSLPIAGLLGCSDEVMSKFRAAAINDVTAGLQSIASGLITGLGTIATPASTDPNSTSSSSSNSGNGGSTGTTGQ